MSRYEVKNSGNNDNNEREVITPKTEDVINKWDGISDWYASYMNVWMSTAITNILPHLFMDKLLKNNSNNNIPIKIIEMGCGDGYNTLKVLKEIYPQNIEYYGVDISHNQIKKAKDTINNNPFIKQYMKLNNTNKVGLFCQNCEELNPKIFKDNTFDKLISNLVLNLTPNPINFLKQAYRVVKPNSICAFTVWGKSIENGYFSLFGKAITNIKTKLDIKISSIKMRSNYHLGNNKENTINMFKKCGFTQIYCWYFNSAAPINNKHNWCEYSLKHPSIQNILNTNKNMDKQKLYTLCYNEFAMIYDQFIGKGIPLLHNYMCIVAKKPSKTD